MELALEFAAGTSLLIIGLSCLFSTGDWVAWLADEQQGGRRRALGLGSLGFVLSALLVGGHPVFTGLPLLLTLIGIGGMLEGTLYLIFPGALPRILSCYAPHYDKIVRALSLAMILFGAFILYAWQEQAGF